MTDKQFAAEYGRLIDFYGFPSTSHTYQGDESEYNRRIIGEWAEMTRLWTITHLNQAITQLIRTRQYPSFPQPGDLNRIHHHILETERRPPITDQPRNPLRAPIDLQIQEIEDALYNLPPQEKQAFRAQLAEHMRPLLENIQPLVEPTTRKGSVQPVILSAFSYPSALMTFETRMQAVKLYAEEHNIALSRSIPSIFNTQLPHRLSEKDIDTRGLDVEEIDTELAAISQEIYDLGGTREKLWKKRRKIEART